MDDLWIDTGISDWCSGYDEMWIVPQATGGWEHLLNGIEYMMFAITLAGIPFVAVVLIESVVGIVKVVRKRA